ncbi:hypothetical protein BZJ19_10015 [Salinivibrio proteolyticus]|uniref:phage major tropism determinant n=1 Tax=Salinivibrio proteolyticus TaxID=334715 RepID=UPI000988DFF2|nr:phage tail protein [Salinivibrio proteolyticus]OOF25047.1 hypothetical protein BZJ19_10015 [Salinivibrio proteolyticus]
MTLTELQNLDFRCYVTAAGFNYEATAKATSKTVNITHIQLGKGMLPADQSPVTVTELVESYGEQGRFSASVTEDADNPGGFIAQAIIPADHAIDGQGYVINEAAAVLDNGIVYAYRRVESDFKLVGQGSAKSYILRMRFRPANAEVIHFTIDPSVVLATEQDLNDAIKRHEQKADPHSQYAKEQDFQSHLNASDPHNQYAQKSDFEQFAQRSLLTAKDFVKSTAWEAAFAVAGGVVRTACDIAVIVGDRVVTAGANESIDMPTLVIGADYAIYATHDGLLVSSNFTVPDGYTESNSRRIGGFHYGDSEFKMHSFYDLHFRPRARDPRGMVLDMGERFWADIYLTNTTPDLLGTSAYDAQIADGSSAPKVPAMMGGDGAQQYSDYTQFTANELLACYGKRLPNYQEFQMLARSNVFGYVHGSDPVKTLFDSNSRSIIGCEQVSGHMRQWGAEVWDRGSGTSGYEWYDMTGGYGKMYASHLQGVGASLFGAAWGDSGPSGPRSSTWSSEPSDSNKYRGSRGICDHFLLV